MLLTIRMSDHIHDGIDRDFIVNNLHHLDLTPGTHRVNVPTDTSHRVGCVKLTEEMRSKVFQAHRENRKYPSPVIYEADCMDVIELSNEITVIYTIKNQRSTEFFEIKDSGEIGDSLNVTYGTLQFITGYACGKEASPKEPFTAKPDEYEHCVEFWRNHALIADDYSEGNLRKVDYIPGYAKQV